jgi:hypothetical protein
MTPNERELEEGDVVQLAPDCRNVLFSACFATVREPKPIGAMVYIQMTGENGEPGGQAYYFAQWAEMAYVGKAEWIVKRGDGDEA